MLVFKSSFFCCPSTGPGPTTDYYLERYIPAYGAVTEIDLADGFRFDGFTTDAFGGQVLLPDNDTIITHNFNRYPLVEVLAASGSQFADAFTFDGYTTDAFGDGLELVEIPDDAYTIKYVNKNEIIFTKKTNQDVYVLLRA